MEYLVTMTTHVPAGTTDEAVADVRAREGAHTRELAAQGHMLRLWRPPLAPLEPHPNDPGAPRDQAAGDRPPGAEFLTLFTVVVPDGTPGDVVEETSRGEARSAHELGAQGHLIRLWALPSEDGAWHALGLWRAEDGGHLWIRCRCTPG